MLMTEHIFSVLQNLSCPLFNKIILKNAVKNLTVSNEVGCMSLILCVPLIYCIFDSGTKNPNVFYN